MHLPTWQSSCGWFLPYGPHATLGISMFDFRSLSPTGIAFNSASICGKRESSSVARRHTLAFMSFQLDFSFSRLSFRPLGGALCMPVLANLLGRPLYLTSSDLWALLFVLERELELFPMMFQREPIPQTRIPSTHGPHVLFLQRLNQRE